MAPKRFRGRRKAGADAEIVGSPADGGERCADVVRGATHDRRRTGDAPHEVEGKVVAAEVHSTGPHRHGDVGTIIDDDQRVGPRPAAGQFDRHADAIDQRRNGERFVAHLDHPHPGVEQALDEGAETAGILPAIDEHTERDPGEAFARAGQHERRALQVIKAVAERLEPRGEGRPEEERPFLEAPQRLGRTGPIGSDQIGRRPARERVDRTDPRADIPGDVAQPDPLGERLGGEEVAKIVAEAFGNGGEVGIVEDEPKHILDDPQRLGGPIGGGIEGPPRPSAARWVRCDRGSVETRAGGLLRGIGSLVAGDDRHAGVVPPRPPARPSALPLRRAGEGFSGPRFGLAFCRQVPTLLPPTGLARPPVPLPGVVVITTRSLTLLWPGLPWLWLRGSVAGLCLAVAFAVALDVAIVLTWVWTELVGREFALGLWAATAGVWVVATLSAVTTFPAPLPTGRSEAAEALFVAARDAYLGRDWLAAETKLRGLLVVAPTDGEAQLLLATLLRRVGRRAESRTALEKLSRSDAGRPWLGVIRRELSRLESTLLAPTAEGEGGAEAVVLRLPSDRSSGDMAPRRAA